MTGFKRLWKTVSVGRLRRDGKTIITCEVSGDDVPLGRLLEGFAPADTQAGELAFRSGMRRQLSAIQHGQNEELVKRDCPSILTISPSRDFRLLDTYLEYATEQEELDLILYCEWEKGWHPTKDSVYRFRPEKEWFSSLKDKWSEFAKVTKRVAPLAGLGGSLMGAPAVGSTIKELAEKAAKVVLDEVNPSGALIKELGLRDQAGTIDLDARHLLTRLIKFLDAKRGGASPEFGGLHPYHLREDGSLLWLCSEHRGQYESARWG